MGNTNDLSIISAGFTHNHRITLYITSSLTSAFAGLRLLLEICQLTILPKLLYNFFKCTCLAQIKWSDLINWKYFTLLSNYLEIPMYILSLVFVNVLHRDCLCPSRLQWQAGTIAVFLSWIIFLLFLNKWPSLGVYIGMFLKIIWRFLLVSVIFILLLISFAFAFYMAFYEPNLPVRELIDWNSL